MEGLFSINDMNNFMFAGFNKNVRQFGVAHEI